METKRKKQVTAIVAGAAVCLLAGAGIIFWFTQRDTKEETVSTVETSSAQATETETQAASGAIPATPENVVPKRAKSLSQVNADTVGWITIPGTQVDNPIVQAGDNDYYLDKNFEHEEFRAGTVFMDYRNVFGAEEAAQSENIVLYGHNMANNSMFGSLRRYRQDYTYYKTAPFIELYSNFQHYTYVICGLLITDGSAEAQWRYWDMESLPDKETFDAYMETVRQKALTEIPVDVQYGDKLLTLSTCYSDADDSRFLIIARRIREGETPQTFAKLFAE